MIPNLRKQFNSSFTQERYEKYLSFIEHSVPDSIHFRIAETPIFVGIDLTKKLLEAGDTICTEILDPDFNKLTEYSIPENVKTPNEPSHPDCLVMDFAIAVDHHNNIVPKLIELQGFPSLFGFEVLQNDAIQSVFTIPQNYSCFLNGYTKASYIKHLEIMIKGTRNKHTVLLELLPHQQKTRVDFYYTDILISLPIVCITELILEGQSLYYNRDGIKHKIERIYNRVVMDELEKQIPSIQAKGALIKLATDLEWVTHPHHFFRISKYCIPFLKHESVPSTQFLHIFNQGVLKNTSKLPEDLSDYVIKPLFSFAGQGVIIDIQNGDIDNIKDPENWIIQEKVKYAPIIETPTGNAKAEIRLFYFWDIVKEKYIAVNNLTRLSKGKMIGVNYNQTATWVGGSLAYFEKF